MASSNSHQILISYGAFYLPLAVLAGLSISAILPAALSFLFSAIDSALFISFPSLWRAFLSWITPSCLFVLLNGIIVVLTASSGAFSKSESYYGSEFYASLLGKIGNSQVASSGALMADSSGLDSQPKLLPNKGFAEKQHREAAVENNCFLPSSQAALQRCSSYSSRGKLLPASSRSMLPMPHVYQYAAGRHVALQRCSSYLSRGTLLPASAQSMLRTRMPPVYHDAQVDVFEAEEPKTFSREEDGVYEYPSNLPSKEEEDDGVYEYPSKLSSKAMESKTFSCMLSNIKIQEEEEEEEQQEKQEQEKEEEEQEEQQEKEQQEKEEEEQEEQEQEQEQEEDNEEMLFELPKLSIMRKSFSFGCQSEPSSPQFATPLKGNTIKRSLSVDSASFNDNHQASYVSPDELSDEAFRERIEDFIFRMNAKLRSQAK